MDYGIKDRIAVVTGAGQGIGFAAAAALAAEGAVVCVNDIDREAAENAAESLRKLGAKSVAAPGDISKEGEIVRLFEEIHRQAGTVDILVNNAGYSPKTPFEEISAEEFTRVMSINLLGTFLCSKYAFKDMREKRWGRIINLSSMAGRFGANHAGMHYSATKGGIISMTLTQAKKMGPYNVTANCLAPGRIDTALTRVLPGSVIEEIVEKIPLKRLGTAEEVANVITFLASEASSYISGACIDVLGGYIA